MSVQSSTQPVASVLGVVVHDGKVLLVRRINPPDVGKWVYPGGWIDPGVTIAQAVVRELFEETEVRTEARRVFNALDAFDYDEEGAPRPQFVMVAVLGTWVSGSLIAGEDATEAAWFPIAMLSRLEECQRRRGYFSLPSTESYRLSIVCPLLVRSKGRP
jgi:ADP-ribose pyrophosphatase YjhB (NUDIX family)